MLKMKSEMYIPENFLATGGCFKHKVRCYAGNSFISSLSTFSIHASHFFVTSEHSKYKIIEKNGIILMIEREVLQ